MISFLRGKVAGTGAEHVVIDIGGVGYKVYVPTSILGFLADGNDDITVYTYMHVREDALQLFGFLNEGDREVFEMLLQVSGIGPKVGLAILSAMPAAAFIRGVIQEQVHVLTQCPGVGKKVAQRVIIELKDKLEKVKIGGDPEISGLDVKTSDAAGDALQALIALGYNPSEAKKALGKIPNRETGDHQPEDIVRMALKELGRF